jgi:hypothetical protein
MHQSTSSGFQSVISTVLAQDETFKALIEQAVERIVQEIVANRVEVEIPDFPTIPDPVDVSMIESRLERVLFLLAKEETPLDLSEVLDAVRGIDIEIPEMESVDLSPLVNSLDRLEQKLEEKNTLPKEYLVDRDHNGKIRIEVVV